MITFRYVHGVQVDGIRKTQRKQRPFDFTKYNTRHVALKIAYLGWDYQVIPAVIGILVSFNCTISIAKCSLTTEILSISQMHDL